MIGQKYKHINSGRIYEVIAVSLLKEHGVWENTVVTYKSMEDGVTWCRFENNFLKSFKILITQGV